MGLMSRANSTAPNAHAVAAAKATQAAPRRKRAMTTGCGVVLKFVMPAVTGQTLWGRGWYRPDLNGVCRAASKSAISLLREPSDLSICRQLSKGGGLQARFRVRASSLAYISSAARLE